MNSTEALHQQNTHCFSSMNVASSAKFHFMNAFLRGNAIHAVFIKHIFRYKNLSESQPALTYLHTSWIFNELIELCNYKVSIVTVCKLCHHRFYVASNSHKWWFWNRFRFARFLNKFVVLLVYMIDGDLPIRIQKQFINKFTATILLFIFFFWNLKVMRTLKTNKKS